MIGWIDAEWLAILALISAFGAALTLALYIRKKVLDYLRNTVIRAKRKPDEKFFTAISIPSILWCATFGLVPVWTLGGLAQKWETVTGCAIWTLLLSSLAIPLLGLTSSAIAYYGRLTGIDRKIILLSKIIARTVILIAVVTAALSIWDAATNFLLLLFLVVFLTALFTFREGFPNVFARIQIGANHKIRRGDYVKLRSGEEGYVTRIGWKNTLIQTLEESAANVPNNQIMHYTIASCRKSLKKASKAFRFKIPEVTKQPAGLKARNLLELKEGIKILPDEVIYCHTWLYIEENPYQAGGLRNDFAIWTRNALGDKAFSERLASIPIWEFASLKDLRLGLIQVIEDYLTSEYIPVNVPAGKEFYFVKAIRTVTQTKYKAYDLRGFAEAVRKISVDSLYYHLFGSRYFQEDGINDFSRWLEEILGETGIDKEINTMNPYIHSPECIRSELIKIIEKRIQ